MVDLTNQILGGYHFQWRLADGGAATIYAGERAGDPHAGAVALKVLHSRLALDPVTRERFRREVELGKRLKHRNIAQVYELVESEGHVFMVMQYLGGGSLAERIEEQGPLRWLDALDVLKQIGRALDYAHKQGVVHRDVKPNNILFDQYGDAYLANFGVAHEADASTLTATGFQPGTMTFMSPEQIQGLKVDPRSDQFSLAVVFYYMLTGELPFQAPAAAALAYQIVHKSPKRLPKRDDIPSRAQKVIAKALAKKPDERYQDIAAFIHALEDVTVMSGASNAWNLVVIGGGVSVLLILGFLLLTRVGKRENVFTPTPPRTASATGVISESRSHDVPGSPSATSVPDEQVAPTIEVTSNMTSTLDDKAENASISMTTVVTLPLETDSITEAMSQTQPISALTESSSGETAPISTPLSTLTLTSTSRLTTTIPTTGASQVVTASDFSPLTDASLSHIQITLSAFQGDARGETYTFGWRPSLPSPERRTFESIVWTDPFNFLLAGAGQPGGVEGVDEAEALFTDPNSFTDEPLYVSVCIIQKKPLKRLYCTEGRIILPEFGNDVSELNRGSGEGRSHGNE